MRDELNIWALVLNASWIVQLVLLVLLLALEVSRVGTTSLLVLVVVVVAATPLLNSRLALFLVGRRTGGGRDAKDRSNQRDKLNS